MRLIREHLSSSAAIDLICRASECIDCSVPGSFHFPLTRRSRAQFVAAPFRGLLQSPCQNCGRTGRTLGTAPAADHFPANLSRVAERKARHPFLRASAALRLPETRKEAWRDTAASILLILIRS